MNKRSDRIGYPLKTSGESLRKAVVAEPRIGAGGFVGARASGKDISGDVCDHHSGF
jgi:hypothetical protein